ncbi:MAG: S-adenosylmethionine:tRNA ribosyltransferase-isomerase, partial [Spirochaetota bacterium]
MDQFDIKVPEELIAQYPAQQRDHSRLLVLDVDNNRIIDRVFKDILDYITPNDCIIYNNARVINARLFGTKAKTGARLEVLLTRNINNKEWYCLIRPARRVSEGTVLEINKHHSLRVIEKHNEGVFRVRFSLPVDYSKLEYLGKIPLPKYIRREPVKDVDDYRYQTVYSEKYGAVASPTAGLHFTESIVQEIKNKGAFFVPVTLHVDWATFRPVKEKDYRDHQMHKEEYEISDSSAQYINEAITQNRR